MKTSFPNCNESVEAEEKNNRGKLTIHRREFIKTVGKAAVGVTLAPLLHLTPATEARGPNEPAEKMVKVLYDNLTPEQQSIVLLPWNDKRRLRVENNWRVVPQRIADIYSKTQQETIDAILRGVTNEVGYEKLMRAMKDDSGGLGNYSACLFHTGDKGETTPSRLAFLLTGRHQTLRADGGTEKNAVFGGPIFYGHAVEFNERPDHPGNVWWHQARLASKVFSALDEKQRKLALVQGTSPEDSPACIRLKGENGQFSGIPISELSPDQKTLVESVMRGLLEPYRQSDVDEAFLAIKANGGLEAVHLSFYQDGDLPDENGIWDRWKIEGPTLAWYFRGSPHVHTWVNVKHKVDS